MKNYIGKKYILLNFNNTILNSFIIKYQKVVIIPEKVWVDGSVSAERQEVLVSTNNAGYNRVDQFCIIA